MSQKDAPKNSRTLGIARELVYKYHADQWRRRYPLPFDTHVYLVAHRLAKWGITDEVPFVMECSLLHDVIEDAGDRAAEAGEEIYNRLGPRYYDICMELTFVHSKIQEKNKYQQKSDYLSSFADKTVEALVIKSADRLYNSEDFEPTTADPDPARQLKYLGNAASLYIAVDQRRSEIEAAFGASFYQKMAQDILRVHTSLGVPCPAMI